MTARSGLRDRTSTGRRCPSGRSGRRSATLGSGMNWTYVQYVALIAVAVLLFWLPTRIEVHWAARDGTRCICRGQLRDDTGMAQTPWREYRVQVAPNGDVVAYRRSLFGGRRGGSWRVVGRADDVPHRKAEFLLRPQHEMTPACDAGRASARRQSCRGRARRAGAAGRDGPLTRPRSPGFLKCCLSCLEVSLEVWDIAASSPGEAPSLRRPTTATGRCYVMTLRSVHRRQS